MSVSLMIIIMFCLNIIWAVCNWKSEWNAMITALKNPIIMGEIRLNGKHNWYININIFTTMIKFAGDIVITAGATSLFGFSGYQGSAMALFMSNILSIAFFTPRKKKINN